MHLALALLFLVFPFLPGQARAEMGASLSLFSDDRFRGHSLSNGNPVAILDLSYDDASGLYLAGSATAVLNAPGPQPLNIRANIGYAWKLSSGPSVDLGAIASGYSEYYSGGEKAHYVEFYGGMVTDHLSAHLFYSPGYFRPGVQTLYYEMEASIRPDPQWRLAAHAGVLLRLVGPGGADMDKAHYDWRLSVAREAGPFELQLALSGGGTDADYHDGRRHRRNSVTAGITYIF